jgi:hypothetical protein
MPMVEIELRAREILCAQFAFKKILSFTCCVIAIESTYNISDLKH